MRFIFRMAIDGPSPYEDQLVNFLFWIGIDITDWEVNPYVRFLGGPQTVAAVIGFALLVMYLTGKSKGKKK